jgi:flavin reductase (DIM6/NTAB) family NADH-FMN oxidoreductase RutF
MKIEIGKTRPENFRESWPGEYSYFSHFEHGAIVPDVLSMITTKKESGIPNACFHSGTVFTGDPGAYYVVMPGFVEGSHTYANILRDREFCVNFLSSKYYPACKKTVQFNSDEDDEIAAGGFTPERCKTIGVPRIGEAMLSFECKLISAQAIDGRGRNILLIVEVQLAHGDENCHKLDMLCGENGCMYNIPSPQNPLTEERMPTAAAFLKPFDL